MVQWLRIPLPVQGAWVWSLVGELRSHTWCHNQRARTLQQEKPAQQRGHMLQPRPSTVKIYKQFFKDHKGYVAILKPSHSFPPYSSWTEETTRIQKRLEPQDEGAQIRGWPSRAGPPFYPLSLWHEWGKNFSYAKPLSSKEFCLPRLVH